MEQRRMILYGILIGISLCGIVFQPVDGNEGTGMWSLTVEAMTIVVLRGPRSLAFSGF